MNQTVRIAVAVDPRLSLIRSASLAVAEPDTCCYPKRYATLKKRNKLPSPLWGHCAPVSHVVRAAFGGDFMVGYVKGIRNFWNRLPDGNEIDLTSCQYGGDGFTPLVNGELVPVYMIEPVPFQFLWFTHLVKRWLGGPVPTVQAEVSEVQK